MKHGPQSGDDRLVTAELMRAFLTRRALLRGIVGAGLAGLLAACGGSDDEPQDPTQEPQDSTPATAETEATASPALDASRRTIQHIFGETTIEGAPERIVTVGLTDQDPVFALGMAPVASQPWYAEQVVYPWAEEAFDGITTEMLPAGELDIEAVAALDPDLIIAITTSIDAEQYDLLSRIAPTVASSPDYDAATIPWQEQTRIVGRALGMEEQAEERIAGVEQQFAEAAERHPEWRGAEVLLASQFIDGQLLVYPSDDPIMSFLTGLGFTIAPSLDELMNDDFGVPTLSAERFNLLEVDFILWDGNRDALEAAGLFDLPTFTNLAVAQEGRMVFPSPEVADALSFKNVLSLPWALRQLEDNIAAAFDGDPATTADGASDEQASPTDGDATSEPAAETGTREFEHAFGVATIPAAPQRVVTLTPFAFDAAIDVGITPVASVSNVGSLLEHRLADVEIALDPVEPDLEAAIAANPDLVLILASEGEPQPARALELESVAPVVAFDAESSAQWKEIFRFFADALNKADEGKQVLSEYDARVAELREFFGDQVGTTEVRVVRVRAGDGVSIYLRDSFPGTVLDDVGFARPEGEPSEGFGVGLSIERLGEIDADHIFIWSFSATPEGAEADLEYFENEILNTPLWEQLGAVREGRVYFVGDYWIGAGVAAAKQILDDLFTHLADGEA